MLRIHIVTYNLYTTQIITLNFGMPLNFIKSFIIKCSSATSFFTRSQISCFILAAEGVERPRILEKPQSVTVDEGKSVHLEVFAIGQPTPDVVWLKDNVLLIPEKHPEFK